ncbi:MAG TPA: hypothetical protein VJP88_02410, partial [Caulobacteraceae bacterium]|nr:hypothetical protein [Caulobacteraceae bacterium]
LLSGLLSGATAFSGEAIVSVEAPIHRVARVDCKSVVTRARAQGGLAVAPGAAFRDPQPDASREGLTGAAAPEQEGRLRPGSDWSTQCRY